MTPDEWEEFEARTRREAVTTLWDPFTTELMGASRQERGPGIMEDLRLSILGDPDFKGPIIFRTQQGGQNVQLRFTAADLDRVEWRELPNVVLFDEGEHGFPTLVANAKRQLNSQRGYLVPSLYLMSTWVFDEMTKSTPEEGGGPVQMQDPTTQLRLYPDEALGQVCRPVPLEEIPPDVLRAARDMATVMYAREGVGLAAPQLGHDWRVIVWDPAADGSRLQYLLNPEIVGSSGSSLDQEGCLSFPGLLLMVRRALQVVVEAHDLEGQPLHIEAEGFDAVILQHEIDHLEGKTFLDRVPPAVRRRALKRWKRGT